MSKGVNKMPGKINGLSFKYFRTGCLSTFSGTFFRNRVGHRARNYELFQFSVRRQNLSHRSAYVKACAGIGRRDVGRAGTALVYSRIQAILSRSE